MSDALTVQNDPAEEPVGSILIIYLSYLKNIIGCSISEKRDITSEFEILYSNVFC